jgi:hypothetical protein
VSDGVPAAEQAVLSAPAFQLVFIAAVRLFGDDEGHLAAIQREGEILDELAGPG